MRNEKVSCDSCGRDITTSGNSIDYRIVLQSEVVPFEGIGCTDMMIWPQIKGAKHFCGITCLKTWVGQLP